ncbi:MAG: phage head closure protein [Firmicutes bacterium]|nr:phage head closure protein [Bacillota bacterium]
MDFSKLRHRVIFLKPTDNILNSMGETVPRYKPFKPYLPLPLQAEGEKIYLSRDADGNASLVYADGKPYAHKLALKEYSVAAFVSPVKSRETGVDVIYKISTRFFRKIDPEMRILYDGKEFEILSVVDIDERHEELQIIVAEVDLNTPQNYTSGDDYE